MPKAYLLNVSFAVMANCKWIIEIANAQNANALGSVPVPRGLSPDVAGVGHGAVGVVIATRWSAVGPLGTPAAEQLLKFFFAHFIPPAGPLRQISVYALIRVAPLHNPAVRRQNWYCAKHGKGNPYLIHFVIHTALLIAAVTLVVILYKSAKLDTTAGNVFLIVSVEPEVVKHAKQSGKGKLKIFGNEKRSPTHGHDRHARSDMDDSEALQSELLVDDVHRWDLERGWKDKL